MFAALLLTGCPTELEYINKGSSTTDGATATMTWNGNWTQVSETIYMSNAIGNRANTIERLDTIYTSDAIGDSDNTIERLDIVASGAGTITIQITASSEANCDYGYASRLDTEVSTSNYQMRVSGTEVATYAYTIPAGAHWIQFMYQKDGSKTSGSDNITVEIISSSFASSSAATATLKLQNQSSVTLADVKWGNTVVSASLAPSESTTLNVSEGAFYLYFTKGSADGFKCRTKETIVAKDKAITQTITNNTVVVDLNDATNVAPLGTIGPRETRLTIQNQSSVTLTDVKWGNTVVSASLAPSESTTMNVSEGTFYLYFTKGSANGLKYRTQETIAVAKGETTTQTMTNDTVVVDLNDATNVRPLGTGSTGTWGTGSTGTWGTGSTGGGYGSAGVGYEWGTGSTGGGGYGSAGVGYEWGTGSTGDWDDWGTGSTGDWDTW
jgi:hypothetical protein